MLSLKNLLADQTCSSGPNLNIGLIENDLIDYQYYFYYELGNFAQKEKIEFKLEYVENNIDDYDIIFGEWYDLSKLSLNKTTYPIEITEFYLENGLKFKENILPLDLDTFILLSHQKNSLTNLEELSNYYDPVKYTIGLRYNHVQNFTKLFKFTTHQKNIDFSSHITEAALNSFGKLNKITNKNIIESNFLDIYNSYENKENVFTLFSDGIVLYKNRGNSYFRLFPQANFIWDKKSGLFKKTNDQIPYSFFGLSAYINNINQIGFICHLIREDVRINTFQNFNLQISPLSINELKTFKNLPDGYEKIVSKKNMNIIDTDYTKQKKEIMTMQEIIFGNKSYNELIETNNYLN